MARAVLLGGLLVLVGSWLAAAPPPASESSPEKTSTGPTVYVACNLGEADLLHLSVSFTHMNILGRRLARARGVPFIYTPRGCLDPIRLRERRWSKRAFLALFERRIIRDADALHVLTEQEREQVTSQGGDPGRCFVIPNASGIDPDGPFPDGAIFRRHAGIEPGAVIGHRDVEAVGLYAPLHHDFGVARRILRRVLEDVRQRDRGEAGIDLHFHLARSIHAKWASLEFIPGVRECRIHHVIGRDPVSIDGDRCGVNAGYVHFDEATPMEAMSDRVIDIAGHMQKYAEPNTVAVARKLSAILHTLWRTGDEYRPTRESSSASSTEELGEQLGEQIGGTGPVTPPATSGSTVVPRGRRRAGPRAARA